MKVLISGHYGGINLGDDAILCTLKDTLRTICGDELEVTALSHDPMFTSNQTGVNSVKHISPRPSILHDVYNVIKTISLSDYILIGGGGLLQDEFNMQTIPRYLFPAIIGKAYRKRVILYALGVGPLNRGYSKRVIRLVSRHADAITVRDEESKRIMEDLGIRGVAVVPDPVVRLRKSDEGRTNEILDEENIDPKGKPKIGVCLRGIYHTKGSDSGPVRPLSDEQKKCITRNLEEIAATLKGLVVFFSSDNSMDKRISEEIARRCTCDTRVVSGQYHPSEFAGILGSMDVLISMPLHSVIIASTSCVPIVGIEYNPKVGNFMRRVGLAEYVLPIERLHLLKHKVFQIWNERVAVREQLMKRIGRLQDESIRSLHEILHSGGRVVMQRNMQAVVFSGLYTILGFIPAYFTHKYGNHNRN